MIAAETTTVPTEVQVLILKLFLTVGISVIYYTATTFVIYLLWRLFRNRYIMLEKWQGYRLGVATGIITDWLINTAVILTRQVGPEWIEHLLGHNWAATRTTVLLFVGVVWFCELSKAKTRTTRANVWLSMNYIAGAFAITIMLTVTESLLRSYAM